MNASNAATAKPTHALPPPVVRYLSFALGDERRSIAGARLEQTGTMRGDAGDAWKPFTAVERFTTQPVGFVWEASWRIAPLLHVRVCDRYAGGTGATEAKIFGIRVAGSRGTPEMTSASLVRYLAEAAWLPTALVPSRTVVWEAIDDARARVTLTDRGTSATVDVEFGSRGEIERVSTTRFRDVRGTPVATPWAGCFMEYARVDGMMVPMAAEVAWIVAGEPVPVWRGRVVKAEYDYVSGSPVWR